MAILTAFLLVALYGGYRAATLLATLSGSAWADLGKGIVATFLRVSVALAITLIWAIPVGVFIGTNRRLSRFFSPSCKWLHRFWRGRFFR
jgi:NitT/TauT family transport system permease protein